MMKHSRNVSHGEAPGVCVERLVDGPIISANLHPSIGLNIQGPSMIRVPDWIENRLGDYYLYFADHRAAISGSPMQITYWDRGESIRRAVCSSKSRVF